MILGSISKYGNYEYDFFKMKHNILQYRSSTTYFLSVVIFLASTCLILLIVLFASCVINCKQRARLNYYNENEFFTYYNNHAKKRQIVSSVSSFSITTAAPQYASNRFKGHLKKAPNLMKCVPNLMKESDEITSGNHNRYWNLFCTLSKNL